MSEYVFFLESFAAKEPFRIPSKPFGASLLAQFKQMEEGIEVVRVANISNLKGTVMIQYMEAKVAKVAMTALVPVMI